MKIFALETDSDKIVEQFCHGNECVVLKTYYHGLSFFFASIRDAIVTMLLFAAVIAAIVFGLPIFWVVLAASLCWFLFVFFSLLRAYIDWAYDFILVTTDKIVLIDQSSIFKQEIKPIHLENVGSVSTATQYWDIFPFGALQINLKEGEGGEVIVKTFVPRAQEVAAVMSDVVTRFQRGGHDALYQSAQSIHPSS